MAALVRERIEKRVAPRLEQQHEASIAVSSDRSRFIQSSIDEVRNTALFGGLLAVGVLFFFLRDIRSTAIVAVARLVIPAHPPCAKDDAAVAE